MRQMPAQSKPPSSPPTSDPDSDMGMGMGGPNAIRNAGNLNSSIDCNNFSSNNSDSQSRMPAAMSEEGGSDAGANTAHQVFGARPR